MQIRRKEKKNKVKLTLIWGKKMLNSRLGEFGRTYYQTQTATNKTPISQKSNFFNSLANTKVLNPLIQTYDFIL